MKNNKKFYTLNLILLVILSSAMIGAARAQSNDIDSPTVLTSNLIEGEGDGKAETVYYTFTALKGDVKVTVDAKTDDRSMPLRVVLLDEDGKELLPIYVVAKGAGAREVGSRRFVRETKVILKIRMDEYQDANLLSYKIKLDGAIKVETPPVAETPTTQTVADEQTPVSSEQNTTNQTPASSTTESQTTTETKTDEKKTTLKDKIKKKAKEKTKETLKGIIDN